MDASLRWLASLLDSGEPDNPLTVAEADGALTAAGFPLDGVEERDGDALLDVEVTSNRGDCLCHLGLAREIAAITGRVLTPRRLPTPAPGPALGDTLTLDNQLATGDRPACPTFTARVIVGARIGPSPAWLRELLESVGQRSINNAVDVTNWLNLELGNPAHVFDLDRLGGGRLVVREARAGERLTTLDGVDRELVGGEVVVADDAGPVSLAGVIGGAGSQVTEATTAIVLEVATWDPARVRAAARAHNVRTDSSHRFERVVDARTCDAAGEAAAALIADLTGGRLCEGALASGAPLPEATPIRLRPERCERLLGVATPADEIVRLLRSVDVGVRVEGEALSCTPPPQRAHDLTREADMVEEVARLRGFDAIPTPEVLPIRVRPPQASERAREAIGQTLVGLGYYETVTFSFVAPDKAEPFLPPGASAVHVDDERRGAEPTLRPSVLPSLLACRRLNRDAQAQVAGGVRLFEMAATFWSLGAGTNEEGRRLALLADVPGESPRPAPEQLQRGVREVRGALEALAGVCLGRDAELWVSPGGQLPGAIGPAAGGRVLARGGDGAVLDLGVMGLPTPATLALFGLERPVVLAEVDLDAMIAPYPPHPRLRPLPSFPGIERDLSVVVPAATPWAQVRDVVEGLGLERLQGVGFVGTYAGKQVGGGRKSVTLRLAFRDPSRTMRHEEVDPQVERALAALRDALGAEARA